MELDQSMVSSQSDVQQMLIYSLVSAQAENGEQPAWRVVTAPPQSGCFSVRAWPAAGMVSSENPRSVWLVLSQTMASRLYNGEQLVFKISLVHAQSEHSQQVREMSSTV